jgi:hypothetical protein
MPLVVRRKPGQTDDNIISEFRQKIVKYRYIDLIRNTLVHYNDAAKRNMARNSKPPRRRIK